MASRLDRRALPAWLAATALSALGWWFGSGLYPLWWLTWLAPLPVLWLAPRSRAHWAALAAFVAYAIGGLNLWTYAHTDIGLPLAVIVYVLSLPALAFALGVLLFRHLLLRKRALAAALAMPATWVAVEYINNLVSPHGTWGSIAYTQMDALPVIQIAAVTGLWGIGFLVLLLPAAAAAQAAPQLSRRARVTTVTIAVSLIAAVLIYGACRLRAPAASTLRIGLVSLDKPVQPSLQDTDGQALQARYAMAAQRLSSEGARVVVIPETSFSSDTSTLPAFAQLAQRHDLILDVGVAFKGDPHAQRNMAMVFQPGLVSPATYSKHHLLPGLDPFTPGQAYRMLDGTPRIGLAICKDMDFHDIGDAYATRGAQLMLVPADDFNVDGWMHSRMAIMRGVESGFAIARAARKGRLTLSDDRGRVLAEASSERQDAELVGDLPLRHTRTLYSRWGDWFAWLDLAMLAALLFAACLPMRQRAD
ncbi:nitrilase-related carbon-nitrogen hydrolase [Dyella agri]|uniref:CN hydrolase domain-containing protein n=1 Tax=Dyella agri TaxID=1926869 RepID=A0ABW8KJZ7_9GAMM